MLNCLKFSFRDYYRKISVKSIRLIVSLPLGTNSTTKMKAFLAIILSLTVFQGVSTAQVNKSSEPISSKKLTNDFIESAMMYPQKDYDNKIEGKVKLQFKVTLEGNATEFKIIKPQSDAMNEESIRLVRKILWKPAIINGRPIESAQTYEIQFNIKHYDKIVKSRGYSRIELYHQNRDNSGKIYNFAELLIKPQPLLKDEFKNLSHFIQKSLKYPDAAYAAGIEGTVKLDFVIEEDGIASNLRIDQSVGGGCDNEAIRILQTIRWKPGLMDGLAVRSHNSLNITFRISEQHQRAIPNRQASGL